MNPESIGYQPEQEPEPVILKHEAKENINKPRQDAIEQKVEISKKPFTFNEGDIISIKKENGDIETDWKIDFMRNDTITAKKGHAMILDIPKKTLLELNKPESDLTIDNAENRLELFKALNGIEGFIGPNGKLPREETKEAINDMLNGKTTDSLTPFIALQKKVNQIIKEEKKLTEEKKNLEKETVDIKIIQERLKKLNEKK